MKLLKKYYSPWLILLLIALVIVVIGLFFRPDSVSYKLNSKEALVLLNDQSVQISIQDIPGKILIDVRTPDQYSQGHLPNAINIPVRQLLDKGNIKLYDSFSEGGKEVVFYGTDELQATGPVFLLYQLGYKNLRILKGEYTSLNDIKEPDPGSTEISLVDTSLIRTKPVMTVTPENSAAKGKLEPVKKFRKETSSGGGC